VSWTPPSQRAAARAELGRRAEDLVCRYLVEHGFEVLGRNVRVGRLELDVIARRGGLLCFCEVRSRRSDTWLTPAQSIGPAKVRKLREAAARWLRTANLSARELRFDVASVLFDVPEGRLTYLEGAI
jgi:putative endonuclease